MRTAAESGDGTRAPGLPERARTFLVATGVAAVAVSVGATLYGGELRRWWAFAILVGAAAVAQYFSFHTIRNQVFHTTPLFLVAAAMLLPPQLLVLVPLLSHIPDWIRKRYAWYIQTFNILNFTLAIMCAWVMSRLVGDELAGEHGAWAASAAGAALTYVVVNNAGFAIILYLARGHSPLETLHPQTIAADASLACLGIALAAFWRVDAWLVPFAIVPIFLLHAALHLPQLHEEARADAKTGLANARHFMEALTEELTRARRFGRPLSVIAADLDLLRNINNTYGHLAGDAVLAGVADILKAHVRHYDVASRFGGEEFTILLPETTLQEAWEIAERIREAVARTPIWAESAGQFVGVTLSLGVAAFPGHGTDPDDLLHQADLAAYRAKLNGRNRVTRASSRRTARPAAAAPDRALRVLDGGDAAADARAAAKGTLDAVALAVGSVLRQPPSMFPIRAVAALGVAAGAAATILGGNDDVRGLLVVAALTAGGQALALELEHGTISVGAIAALAGAAIFGLRAPLLLAAVMVCTDLVAGRTSPRQTLLSLGTRSFSLLVAAAIFAVGGDTRVGDFLLLVVGPVAGAASFAAASTFLAVAFARERGEEWHHAWRDRFAWLVPHYAVYGFVAAVTAVAYRGAGLYALAAFAVSLLALRKTQQAVVTQARRNAESLRHAAEMIQTQHVSLERVNRLLAQRSMSAMESLTGIVDMRDSYTAGHSRRVRDLVLAMGRELGLSDAELDVLGRAALFHDIGKLAVPDAILLKPSGLSDEEWEVMRRHSDEGARIVGRLGFLGEAIPAIRHHHERIDGLGYPDGLVGDDIPLGARLIHVADAYDSMRTDRIYRAARPEVEALAELRRFAGSQFCPVCVSALERTLANGSFGGATAANGRKFAS